MVLSCVVPTAVTASLKLLILLDDGLNRTALAVRRTKAVSPMSWLIACAISSEDRFGSSRSRRICRWQCCRTGTC